MQRKERVERRLWVSPDFTSWSSGLRTRVEVSDDDGGPEVDARDEVQLALQVLIRELECCEK